MHLFIYLPCVLTIVFNFSFHVPRAKQRDCEDCEEAMNLLNGDSVHGRLQDDGRMCKTNGEKVMKEKLLTKVQCNFILYFIIIILNLFMLYSFSQQTNLFGL